MINLEEDSLKFEYWQNISERLTYSPKISKGLIHTLENNYFQPGYFTERDFEAYSLAEILHYLELGHRYYLDNALPKIENTLEQLHERFKQTHPIIPLLTLFIRKYKTELQQHIQLEENVLFPFIKDVLNGTYDEKRKDFIISHFLHTHNDQEIILVDRLKEDMLQYDQELSTNLPFQILFTQLTVFQADLRLHALVEDHVLLTKLLQALKSH